MLVSLIARLEIFETIFYWYEWFCIFYGATMILIITFIIKRKITNILRNNSDKAYIRHQITRMNIIIAIFSVIVCMSVYGFVNTTITKINSTNLTLNWYAPFDTKAAILYYTLTSLHFIGFLFYSWIPLPCCCLGCLCNRKVINESGIYVPYEIKDDTIYHYVTDLLCKSKPKTFTGPSETVKALKKSKVKLPEPSKTLYRIDSRLKKLPLNKVTDEGKEMGKRGKNKPSKLPSNEAKQKRQENYENNAIPTLDNEREAMNEANVDDFKNDESMEFLYNIETSLKNHGEMVYLSDNEYDDDNENDINNNGNNPNIYDANIDITLILFEYDSVLSTQSSNKLKTKMERWTQERRINVPELKLLFGGDDRVKMLKKTFEKLLDINENLILFCLTEEWSQNVVNLFKKLRYEKYFCSVVGKKRLSHVIGGDSKLVKESNFKKYLLILTLINHLDRKHENVLYISGNKDEIDNVNRINVCHTYHVKTRGLTESDFDFIVKKYFKN